MQKKSPAESDQNTEQSAPGVSDPILARILSGDWISPYDAIADGLLDTDERVVAKMKTGDEVALTYGTLVDAEDSGGYWFGFFNDDGEEIFNEDIEGVRLPAKAHSVSESSS